MDGVKMRERRRRNRPCDVRGKAIRTRALNRLHPFIAEEVRGSDRNVGRHKVACGTHTRPIQPLSIAGCPYHHVG